MNGHADQPPNSTRLSTVVPDMMSTKVRMVNTWPEA